jgi:hypothetical protein
VNSKSFANNIFILLYFKNEFRIQDSGFRIQDSGFKTQDSRPRIQELFDYCNVTSTGIKWLLWPKVFVSFNPPH